MTKERWDVVPISGQHDGSKFDCGEPSLNDYLQKFALANARRGFGQTYVAVIPKTSTILGYYTISGGSIVRESLSSGGPYPTLPAVHLGRLAVDKETQGKGLGRHLLIHAMALAERLSNQVGVHVLDVKSLNDKATRFYRKYGFEPLLDSPDHLFMTIKKIKKLGLND